MTAIDCMIWMVLGAFLGFFLGMMAAVLFMASGRDGE